MGIKENLERFFAEKFKFLDKNKSLFLFFSLFFVLLFLLYFQFNDFSNPIKIGTRETSCLHRLEQGILYRENDITCIQSPLFYTISYSIMKFLPISFSSSVVISFILIFCGIFLFLHKIIKKEVGENHFFSIILYIALIFICGGSYGKSGFNFPTILALFWFMSGFYLLFYSDLRFKNLFSGILFSFSFLSKQTYLIPVAFTIFIFYFKKLYSNTNQNGLKSGIKELFRLIFPFSMAILIFHILFPNFLGYTLSFSKTRFTSFLESLHRL